MDTLRSDGHNLVLPIAKARSVDVVVRCWMDDLQLWRIADRRMPEVVSAASSAQCAAAC